MARAKADAEIVKSARKTFHGGYTACFKNPDGHLWEAVFNPAISVPG